MALLIVLAFVLLCIGINAVISLTQKKKSEQSASETVYPQAISPDTLAAPEGLYYDKSHSWAFMKQNGLVKVGIDDFLVKVTGQLTGVQLLQEGDKIHKGEPLVSVIQNGKRLTIKSPVTGIIRAGNNSLQQNTGRLKSSPYIQGWLYEIEPQNWLREIQLLLIGDKYKQWLRKEVDRLKSFVGEILNNKQLQPGMIALQDGGEPIEGILSELAPEEWEMFQTDFLDKTL